ncbi:hypothetical protein BZA77DRAFT_344906 [Pyronema omphalodes]|nr:hypothetical protein BZA77DRAFT_344906 [Pyronema omphalodes]
MQGINDTVDDEARQMNAAVHQSAGFHISHLTSHISQSTTAYQKWSTARVPFPALEDKYITVEELERVDLEAIPTIKRKTPGKFSSSRSSVGFMDPLSLSASIAGLISLTIEVTKIISEYRSGFKNAPKEASELSTEVAALHHVLETALEILINEYSNSEDTTFDEKNILFSIVDACEEHMNVIHTKMAKLQAGIKGAAKFPLLMARLKWPFEREDCQQSIQIIHRYVQTLQVLLIASNRSLLTQSSEMVMKKLEEQHKMVLSLMAGFTASTGIAMRKLAAGVEDVREGVETVKDGMKNMKTMLEDDEVDKLLQWISPLEPQKTHHSIKSKRLENCGTWFLKTSEYQAWCDGESSDAGFNPILACYGIPGAGKTIMSSLVIDNLSEKISTQKTQVGVAYVYCDYRDDEDKQSVVNMATVLLKQVLITHIKYLPDDVSQSLLRRRNSNKLNMLDLNEALNFLRLVVQNFSKFYICIDALDECKEAPRKELLRLLVNLLDNLKSTRIFVTARIPLRSSVEQAFPVTPHSIILQANADDIRRYVTYQMEMDVNNGKMSDKFTKEIIERIVETADGMFLLPALQIQTVLDQTSIAGRRNALNSMPTKLDNAFQVIIDRIKRQAPGKAHQGMEVLKWTYLIERQLTIDELRHALAAVDCTAEDLEDSLPFENTLTDCCYGLVVIDKETSAVSLVHKSLQEFLKTQHEESDLFSTGHGDIAHTCLHYMNYDDDTMIDHLTRNRKDEYIHGKFSPLRTRSSDVTKYPFLNYAIHFWGEHARRQINPEASRLISDLLLNKESRHCISSNLRLSALEGSFVWRRKVLTTKNPAKYPGLHLLAHFGIDSMLHQFNINAISMLLECGASTSLSDNLGRTPLVWATSTNSSSTIRIINLLLKNGADINLPNDRGQTPFALACAEYQAGGEEVLSLLLDQGADINQPDKENVTPLMRAVRLRREGLVEFLLKKGADPNIANKDGRTALVWAAAAGDQETIRLLLDNGADLRLNNEGGTPLSSASTQAQLPTIDLLIDMGADPNETWGTQRRTPLISAVLAGSTKAVDRLLERGAGLDIPDGEGRTPLCWVITRGEDLQMLNHLIDKGADVNARDKEGRTILDRLKIEKTEKIRTPGELKFLDVAEGVLKEKGGIISEPDVSPVAEPVPCYA